MNNFIKKICNGIVKKYKSNKNVLGIMLFGSVPRNKFDQYSDIDIFILLNKKQKFSRNNFVENGIRIDIIFETRKELSSHLKREKNNVRRIASHMLAYGQILYDTASILGKFQSIAKRNLKLKTKYTSDEILMHKYSINDFWGEIQRDFENNDYLAFELNSHLLMMNIIELFLKIKGDFLKQPNEMTDTINKRDKKLGHYIKKFYKTRSLKDRLIILPKIINRIYKLSSGPLPQKWQIK